MTTASFEARNSAVGPDWTAVYETNVPADAPPETHLLFCTPTVNIEPLAGELTRHVVEDQDDDQSVPDTETGYWRKRVVIAHHLGDTQVFGPVHSKQGMEKLRAKLREHGWRIVRDVKQYSVAEFDALTGEGEPR